MSRSLEVLIERWPLATPFRIARGVRTEAEVVVVVLRQDGMVGRGEGVPIARYIDTPEDCVEQIEDLRPEIEAGLSRRELIVALKPGAARNALDCAMWDLEARLAGKSVAGSRPVSVTTAMTVGLDTPQAMAATAARLAHLPLLKVKLGADDPAARLRSVRAAAPATALIVDCNESWDLALLNEMQPVLTEARVALLEQPLSAGLDEQLRDLWPAVPICADESCHTVADLDGLVGLYQAINIKLDKTGGLTAALDLLAAARAHGLTVMTGCMICTSLSIAPAFNIAAASDFADLDGPSWLAADRPDGVQIHGGVMRPPSGAFWGG